MWLIESNGVFRSRRYYAEFSSFFSRDRLEKSVMNCAWYVCFAVTSISFFCSFWWNTHTHTQNLNQTGCRSSAQQKKKHSNEANIVLRQKNEQRWCITVIYLIWPICTIKPNLGGLVPMRIESFNGELVMKGNKRKRPVCVLLVMMVYSLFLRHHQIEKGV